jgi:hypothetical protein
LFTAPPSIADLADHQQWLFNSRPSTKLQVVGTFEIPDEFGHGTGAMLFGTPAGALEAALCALQASFAAPSMTIDWHRNCLPSPGRGKWRKRCCRRRQAFF